jgi:hypothetical protein
LPTSSTCRAGCAQLNRSYLTLKGGLRAIK